MIKNNSIHNPILEKEIHLRIKFSNLWKELPRNAKFWLLYDKYIHNDNFKDLKQCWNKIFIDFDLKWIDEWNQINWFNNNDNEDLKILKSFLEFYKYFYELGSNLFPKFITWDGGSFNDMKFLSDTKKLIPIIDIIWFEIDSVFKYHKNEKKEKNKINWNRQFLSFNVNYLWEEIFNQIVLISTKPNFIHSSWKNDNLMIDWNGTLYYSKHKIVKSSKSSLKLNGQDILIKNSLYWISIDFWKSIFTPNHNINKNNDKILKIDKIDKVDKVDKEYDFIENFELKCNDSIFKKMDIVAKNFSLFYKNNDKINKLIKTQSIQKLKFMKKSDLKKRIDWSFLFNDKNELYHKNNSFSTNSIQVSESFKLMNDDNIENLIYDNIGCSKKDLKKRGENWNLEVPYPNRGNSININLKEINVSSSLNNYDKILLQKEWYLKSSDYGKYIIKQFLNDCEYLNQDNDKIDEKTIITDSDRFFFFGLKQKGNLKESYDKIYHKCIEHKKLNPKPKLDNINESGKKVNYTVNNYYDKTILIGDWEKNFMKLVV